MKTIKLKSHTHWWHTIALFVSFVVCMPLMAQEVEEDNAFEPTISYTSKEDESEIVMTPGESNTAQAPLQISMEANPNVSPRFCVYEWRIDYTPKGGAPENVLIRRDETTEFTLMEAGNYDIEFTATYGETDTDTITAEFEKFTIVISESELNDPPDGFSPNGDGINDVYHIKYKSIAKMSAVIFNRWGQRLYSMDLSNVDEGWDGRVGGRYVKDGVYFINIVAEGSDGVKYKIKKAINVLKGFHETGETEGGTQ